MVNANLCTNEFGITEVKELTNVKGMSEKGEKAKKSDTKLTRGNKKAL